jgi:hypothetical protein
MADTKDLTQLLAGVPKGAWVALSQEQDRVVAFDADIEEAMKKAKASGEKNPIILRVPETESVLLF